MVGYESVMKVIGLMSGTSGDGVDAALVEIRGHGESLRARPLATLTQPYPASLQRRIVTAGLSGTVTDICHLNAVLGELFARAACEVMRRARVTHRQVALIGSHGQTVHHLPRGVVERGVGQIRSTLQIAEPAIIAERTGITTVANFRARDMAAGGEGAPLVPYVHYLLLCHPTKSRLIVNLGGISNVTYLPRSGGLRGVRAFDTGPANMLMDGLVQRLTRGRLRMDAGGHLATRGRVDSRLLARLLRHKFLTRRPPKSTGREDFGAPVIDQLLREQRRRRLAPNDLLATCVRFAAEAVGTCRQWLPGRVEEVLVCGGGAHNRALMAAMRDVFHPAPVDGIDAAGWNGDSLEAVAFAILAYQTVHGVPSNLPQVTGAAHPVVLGQIVPGSRRAKHRLLRSTG